MIKEMFFKYVNKYYKWIIILVISLICLILCFFYINRFNKRISKESEHFTSNIILEDNSSAKEEVKYFYVEIKGSVMNPNVYKVKEGSRIIDVITLAGGLKEGANTSVLNLSKKVSDEMLIIIYNDVEINELKEEVKTISEVIKIIEKECVCPDPQINGACHSNQEEETPSLKININNASLEELTTIPGIGESKANSIINYRLDNGHFTSIDDIKNVSGIGDSVFDKIKNYLTV